MVAKRIIPCLDVLNGRTVKGVHFKELTDVGDPVELGLKYANEGADELVYLDISATVEGRRTFTGLVSRIAESIDIPFTVGGGIGSLEDASRLLDAGADKITVNSAAIVDPSLIDALAAKYGSQFVTVAIDAKQCGVCGESGKRWMCTVKGGREMTDKELFSWALEAERRGAGEILFTSMDNDGTRNGYPCETYARLAEELTIPVIASGGAGSVQDIADVLTIGKADAALAASIFHYGMMTIGELKRRLIERKIEIRL
jgi:imidazoleglycerol phosphate synthase, cyclase subunit